MGETTREIEAHIDRTREDLVSNIRELDEKVRSATDWKEYFSAHPGLALGLAFGGGALLAGIASGGLSSGSRVTAGFDGASSHMAPAVSTPKPRSVHQAQALETWDHIKGALLGMAALRLTQKIDEMIPGFQDQYQRVQSGGRRTM